MDPPSERCRYRVPAASRLWSLVPPGACRAVLLWNRVPCPIQGSVYPEKQSLIARLSEIGRRASERADPGQDGRGAEDERAGMGQEPARRAHVGPADPGRQQSEAGE